MKAIGWSALIIVGCAACPVHAQDADLPRGAVRRLGSVNLRVDNILCAAFTPDGSTLVTGGRDIRLWDAKTRRLLRTIPFKEGPARRMHITSDGKTLFAFADLAGSVVVFDFASGKQVSRIAAKEKDMAFTAFAVS